MEDYSLPRETIIYFSKEKALLMGAFGIAILVFGLYIMMINENYLEAVPFVFLSALLCYYMIKKRFNNKTPQIIINQLGLQTSAAVFYPWEEIGNETITREHRDKSEFICLEYDCPAGHEEFEISELDITVEQLAHLLIVYRERSGRKYKYDKLL